MGGVVSAITKPVGQIIGGITQPLLGGAGALNQFQAQSAKLAKQNLSPDLAQSLAQYNQTFGNQNSLASQLQALASGIGPNPAQTMLNQATNRAVQQSAGALASSKGISPALAQRLSAQFGAQQTQQAAGQGALMGAQQQLGALSSLGGLYGQQQQGALGAYGTEQQAQTAQNNAALGNATQMNQVGSAIAGQNASTSGKLLGGALNAGGAALGLGGGGGGGFFAQGGMAEQGGDVPGKAKVKGDSYDNDTVSAKLSPGEIVIPRHITMHPNAPELAAQFVQAELQKHHVEKMACGGMYADGGQVPLALSAEAPADNSLFQVPTSVSETPLDQRPEPPVDYNAMADMSQTFNKVAGTDYQAPQPQASSSPQAADLDQGPAIMPRQPQALGSLSGAGGAPVENHLNRIEDIYKQGAEANRQNIYRSQQEEWNQDVERQNLMDQYKNQKLDPNRLFHNMSTGDKVMKSLGLILSGMGSGLTGQPNMAMEFLNKQLDQDLKAQEADMDKSQNLLKINMEKTRDLRSARELTRMQQRDLMADKLQEVENNAQDPVVKQRANAMYGQLMLQNAQTGMQLQMMKQMQQGGQSSDPANQIRRLSVMGSMPKEDKIEAFKELGKAKELGAVKDALHEAVDHIHSQILNGALSPADTASSKMALAGRIVKLTEGRFNQEAAMNIVDAFFPRHLESNQTTENKKKRGDQTFDAMIQTPTLDAYGISPMQKLKQQYGFKPKSFKPMGK